MFNLPGFMKCFIAPTFGAGVWAWFAWNPALFPGLTLNEATLVGLIPGAITALLLMAIFHYARNPWRAIVAGAAVIGCYLLIPPNDLAEMPEFVILGRVSYVPLDLTMIAVLILGGCCWPALYPREVLGIGGGMISSTVTVGVQGVERRNPQLKD